MAGELEQAKPVLHEDIVFSMVIDGDLSKLSDSQVLGYYYHRCELLGLDPGEKPFDLIKLSGKLVLYLTKSGANALTRVNQLDVKIVDKGWDGPMYIVQARATTPVGRGADDIGVIDMDEERTIAKSRGKTPITAANAMMKAATKAKRRAVIAVCGIGLLAEEELEGVRGAERVSIQQLEQPAVGDADPYMTGKLASKATKTMARCAQIAAAKSTDDKLVTPRQVWEGACKKFKLPLMSDGSTPKIEHLRKSIAWPICELVKTWAGMLEVDAEERQPGDDGDEDEPIDVDYVEDPAGVP